MVEVSRDVFLSSQWYLKIKSIQRLHNPILVRSQHFWDFMLNNFKRLWNIDIFGYYRKNWKLSRLKFSILTITERLEYCSMIKFIKFIYKIELKMYGQYGKNFPNVKGVNKVIFLYLPLEGRGKSRCTICWTKNVPIRRISCTDQL